MTIAEIEAIVSKVNAAVDRLKVLIKSGAVQGDIDAQKAVIAKLVVQFNQVIGTVPIP